MSDALMNLTATRREMDDGSEVKPWDGDHTALVHVLWQLDGKGLTLHDDFDEVASLIRASKWHRATRQHAVEDSA